MKKTKKSPKPNSLHFMHWSNSHCYMFHAQYLNEQTNLIQAISITGHNAKTALQSFRSGISIPVYGINFCTVPQVEICCK